MAEMKMWCGPVSILFTKNCCMNFSDTQCRWRLHRQSNHPQNISSSNGNQFNRFEMHDQAIDYIQSHNFISNLLLHRHREIERNGDIRCQLPLSLEMFALIDALIIFAFPCSSITLALTRYWEQLSKRNIFHVILDFFDCRGFSVYLN